MKKIILFGLDAIITNNPEYIERADKLILTGVGHFSNLINKLENYGLIEVLNRMVLIDK